MSNYTPKETDILEEAAPGIEYLERLDPRIVEEALDDLDAYLDQAGRHTVGYALEAGMMLGIPLRKTIKLLRRRGCRL
jgi:hypothetical protein